MSAKRTEMIDETRLERHLDRAVARATTPRGAAIVIATATIAITVGTGALMTVVLTGVADRVGRRRVQVAGAALMLLGGILFGLTLVFIIAMTTMIFLNLIRSRPPRARPNPLGMTSSNTARTWVRPQKTS